MVVLFCIFFFKQKTAYEMRISDWSSDVCSSDLVMEDMIKLWKARQHRAQNLDSWWRQIAGWRDKKSLAFEQTGAEILPQHAVRQLWQATHAKKPIITTEVGQHQMWAAQHFDFEGPTKWATSGGLGPKIGRAECRERGCEVV